MTDIIKVQRPLMTNDESVPWLIYDKSRKRQQQIPESVVPPAAVKAMGNDAKGYFEGRWSSIVGWSIGKRVKEQDW
jgi:hypothetical protein